MSSFDGADILNGRAGSDLLASVSSTATLIGGSGADTFVFVDLGRGIDSAAFVSTIADLNFEEGDQIIIDGDLIPQTSPLFDRN